jgi:hypothetical protein
VARPHDLQEPEVEPERLALGVRRNGAAFG